MKLSDNTKNILKSFLRINKNLVIQPGNRLSTISPNKTVLARAIVEEHFPEKFVIFDLTKLLGALSLMEDPELDFDGPLLTLTEGRAKTKLAAAEEKMVIVPPESDPSLGSPYYKFKLKSDEYKKLTQAAGVLQATEVVIYSERGIAYASVKNESISKDSGYSYELEETTCNFRSIFKTDNFVFIPGDYEVDIYVRDGNGLVKFYNQTMIYWVPTEAKSIYE